MKRGFLASPVTQDQGLSQKDKMVFTAMSGGKNDERFLREDGRYHGRGIRHGALPSLLLAKAGANVAITDINEETLSATAAMVKQYNVAVSSHVVDMGDMDQIEQLPETVIAHHGALISYSITRVSRLVQRLKACLKPIGIGS